MDIEELRKDRKRIDDTIAATVKTAPLPDWAQHIDAALGGGVCTQAVESSNRIDIDAARVGRGCPDHLFGQTHFITASGASGPGMVRFLEALLSLERSREAARAEKVEDDQ